MWIRTFFLPLLLFAAAIALASLLFCSFGAILTSSDGVQNQGKRAEVLPHAALEQAAVGSFAVGPAPCTLLCIYRMF